MSTYSKYIVKFLFIPVFFLSMASCKDTGNGTVTDQPLPPSTQPFLIVLGTIQDAGSPHIACTKNCCKALFLNPDKNRKVVALGIVDPKAQKCYIIEATPDFPEQLYILNSYMPSRKTQTPDGIFLTHAHIGHYTGLMYLGKEGMNAADVPVYAMPRMRSFLTENGPWSQLVARKNIAIQEMAHQKSVQLTAQLHITPFIVPHRDEYSETVGYTIAGPDKKVLFIPDIDKWEKWDTRIAEAIKAVDYAYIDGSFYDAEDINHRDISEIPHPFITESMNLFNALPSEEKSKIRFIHFNHTNPVLQPQSKQTRHITGKGYTIASIYDIMEL